MQDSPAHLKWSNQNPAYHLPTTLYQQLCAQVCMILIHRPYIMSGQNLSPINSHAECSKAAANVFDILEDYKSVFGFHALPNGAVYFLFM